MDIFEHYETEQTRVSFSRDDLVRASDALSFAGIKNLGDIPYSFRFRRELPDDITSTATQKPDTLQT
jgi:hypothetical protein